MSRNPLHLWKERKKKENNSAPQFIFHDIAKHHFFTFRYVTCGKDEAKHDEHADDWDEGGDSRRKKEKQNTRGKAWPLHFG